MPSLCSLHHQDERRKLQSHDLRRLRLWVLLALHEGDLWPALFKVRLPLPFAFLIFKVFFNIYSSLSVLALWNYFISLVSSQSIGLHLLGEEAVEQKEEDPVAAWHIGGRSCGYRPYCWHRHPCNDHWHPRLCGQKGESSQQATGVQNVFIQRSEKWWRSCRLVQRGCVMSVFCTSFVFLVQYFACQKFVKCQPWDVGTKGGVFIICGFTAKRVKLILLNNYSHQIHNRYEGKDISKHKRNLVIAGGVTLSVIVSPVVAAVTVGGEKCLSCFVLFHHLCLACTNTLSLNMFRPPVFSWLICLPFCKCQS